jgi:malate synthase
VGNLKIARLLFDFIAEEAIPGTGLPTTQFWRGFEDLLRELVPRNAALLRHRDILQAQIDQWHRAHPGPDFDRVQYRSFLAGIGYLEPPVEDFAISTQGVDPEIASLAGPQLVVPLDNARYALNAANARWGSLFDALYGTDVIAEANNAGRTPEYNPIRGARVISFAQAFLDRCFPLVTGSHTDVRAYVISDHALLSVQRTDGTLTGLRDATGFRAYLGERTAPQAIFLRHHGLHVEIRLDRNHPIGRQSPAGVCDVVLESALTTIQDCEDSVAAVDAEDKVRVYRNWLGLMQGTLHAAVRKGNRVTDRALIPDLHVRAPTGEEVVLPRRSLLLVRHVGQHIMTTAANFCGEPIAETFLDAAITALIAMHDGRGPQKLRNSRFGSIYCVKPKMHGSAEIDMACDLFARVESMLGLTRHTLKLGLMDEERRTSLNLKQCIYAARHRLVFINTGFLDRTGDDIRTSFEAGPAMRKADLRNADWLKAYERSNVATALRCGLAGRAQIGKGMWTQPDRMAAMLASKIEHLRAGATTSWVPSPVAATLHALHYHEVAIAEVHKSERVLQPVASEELLSPALADRHALQPADIQRELDSNIQSILGYVVRWIDDGIGCSKVPDLDNTALMEDRATLRISSQIISSWLRHGICTQQQVESSILRLARIVDAQNAHEPAYTWLSRDSDHNPALSAARKLVFNAHAQPNGYTEAILWRYRLTQKSSSRPEPACRDANCVTC